MHSKQTLDLISKALLALLKNVVTETLAAGQGDGQLVILATDDEDVVDASGERTPLAVLNVDDLEGTDMLLTTSDDTNTALILTTGDDALSAHLEFDGVGPLASGNVHLDHIVQLGVGVGVPDGTAIVGADIRHTLGTDGHFLDTAHLELVLVGEVLVVQAVDDEATLGIEEHTEMLVGLVNADDIHEPDWKVGVGAHLAVDLDEALHEDLLHLLAGEGVFEAVAQHEDERQALAQLVGTRRGTGSPGAAHLVKHPVLGGVEAFHVFL